MVRPDRPAQAGQRVRQLGVGMGLVWPMSRRLNASIPDHGQRDRDHGHDPDRGPVELAGERDVVGRPAEPGQVRERSQRGDRVW